MTKYVLITLFKMTKYVMTADKQVPVLRSLEYLACYYITGSYMTQDYGYCTRVKHFRDLAYAVSFLPYYWRAMQVYIPLVTEKNDIFCTSVML